MRFLKESPEAEIYQIIKMKMVLQIFALFLTFALAVNLDESKTATEQKLAETPAPTILAQNLTTTI